MGKLNYGYRHITCSKSDDPACAACEITHGGLHLSETAGWKEAKKQITEGGGVEVVQWHKDELNDEVGSLLLSETERWGVHWANLILVVENLD